MEATNEVNKQASKRKVFKYMFTATLLLEN